MSVEDFTAERKRLASEATQQIIDVLPEGYLINQQRGVNVSNTAGEFEVLIVTRKKTSIVNSVTLMAFQLVYRSLDGDRYSIRFKKDKGGTTRWYHFATLEEAIMVGCTRHKLGAYKGAV